MIMLAGYANQPSEFEAGLADFDGLLSRIVIDGQHGFVPPPSEAQAKMSARPKKGRAVAPGSAEEPVAVEAPEVEAFAPNEERSVE